MKLLGTGSYLPHFKLTNEQLEFIVDTDAEWVKEKLGIRERRISTSWAFTSDLATLAALDAIESSGLDVKDIDLLIVATATPDKKAPSTACIVQDKIGAYNAVSFDVNAVCSGFLYAMSIADAFLSMGTYKNALIIGADTFSKITDWTNRDAVFFGDGAGAAIFTFGGETHFRLYSDGRGRDGFVAERFFKMNGRAVYDAAVTFLPKAIGEVLDDAGLTVEDIDMMIPHQPGIGVLKETAMRIGLPFEKVKTNMEWYANTAAATIPILLDEVRPKEGIILFAAMGSGWTYGAAVLKI